MKYSSYKACTSFSVEFIFGPLPNSQDHNVPFSKVAATTFAIQGFHDICNKGLGSLTSLTNTIVCKILD